MSIKVYIVYKQYPYSASPEIIKAFFDEEQARYEAGRRVGQEDSALISLRIIEVEGKPNDH